MTYDDRLNHPTVDEVVEIILIIQDAYKVKQHSQ